MSEYNLGTCTDTRYRRLQGASGQQIRLVSCWLQVLSFALGQRLWKDDSATAVICRAERTHLFVVPA